MAQVQQVGGAQTLKGKDTQQCFEREQGRRESGSGRKEGSRREW